MKKPFNHGSHIVITTKRQTSSNPDAFSASAQITTKLTTSQSVVFNASAYPSVVAAFDADSPTHVTTTVNQTFAPSTVNTSTGVIGITGFPIAAWAESYTTVTLVACYFSSTGTLPSPLQPNTPYVVVQQSGYVQVFPWAQNNQWALVSGAVFGDYIPPYQLAAETRGAVMLTTQGTGTHTIYTNPLLTQVTDLTTNGFNILGSSGAPGTNFELKTHSYGKTFESDGVMVLDYHTGGHNGTAKLMTQAGAGGVTFRNKFLNQRYVWQVSAMEVKPLPPQRITLKIKFIPSAINTSTGVITATGHGFNSGNLGNWITLSPDVAPTVSNGSISGDFYISVVTSSTFKLYVDSGLTNQITFSDQGSGQHTVLCPTRLQTVQDKAYTINIDRPEVANEHIGQIGMRNYPSIAGGLTKTGSFASGYNGKILSGGSSTLYSSGVVPSVPMVFLSANRAVLPYTADRGVSINYSANISGITNANPCVITTSGAHYLQAGDTVYLDTVVGMTGLNQNIFTITSATTNTITISKDSTSLGSYSSGGFTLPVYFASTSSVAAYDFRVHRTLAQSIAMAGVPDSSATFVTFQNYNSFPGVFPEMGTYDEVLYWYVDGAVGFHIGEQVLCLSTRLKANTFAVVSTYTDVTPTPSTTIFRTSAGAVPGSINISTGVVTLASHGFTTSMSLIGKATGSNALPAGTPDGATTTPVVGYAYVTSSSTFQLCTTYEDSLTGANPIIFSDTGTGTWSYCQISTQSSISINGGTPEVIHDWYQNVQTWGLLGTQGGLDSSGTASLILGNAAQPHVPGAWKQGVIVVGTGTTSSTLSDMNNVVSALLTKYRIPYATGATFNISISATGVSQFSAKQNATYRLSASSSIQTNLTASQSILGAIDYLLTEDGNTYEFENGNLLQLEAGDA